MYRFVGGDSSASNKSLSNNTEKGFFFVGRRCRGGCRVVVVAVKWNLYKIYMHIHTLQFVAINARAPATQHYATDDANKMIWEISSDGKKTGIKWRAQRKKKKYMRY